MPVDFKNAENLIDDCEHKFINDRDKEGFPMFPKGVFDRLLKIARFFLNYSRKMEAENKEIIKIDNAALKDLKDLNNIIETQKKTIKELKARIKELEFPKLPEEAIDYIKAHEESIRQERSWAEEIHQKLIDDFVKGIKYKPIDPLMKEFMVP